MKYFIIFDDLMNSKFILPIPTMIGYWMYRSVHKHETKILYSTKVKKYCPPSFAKYRENMFFHELL